MPKFPPDVQLETKINDVTMEDIKPQIKSSSSHRFQTPISISSSQTTQEDETNSSINNDQVNVINEGFNAYKVILQGDTRCEKCKERKKEACVIKLGRGNESVAKCDHCRRKNYTVAICNPNIEILKYHLPNNKQIEESYERILNARKKASKKKKQVLQNLNLDFIPIASTSSSSINQHPIKEEFENNGDIMVPISRSTRSNFCNEDFEITEVRMAEKGLPSFPSIPKNNTLPSSSNLAKGSSQIRPLEQTALKMNFDKNKKDASILNRLDDVEKMLDCEGDAELRLAVAQIAVKAIRRDWTN